MKDKNNLIALALPGLVIAFLLSFLGERFSRTHPLLDALFIAFIGGILVGNSIRNKSILWLGTALCKDILLPLGLLLYGTQINLLEVMKLNPAVMVISLVNMVLYLVLIFLSNKYLFGICNNKISYLNGGANAICGVTATAVFIPFVDAKDDEVSATLLAVVITGLISVGATWFIIQHAVGLSARHYAVFCGLTLNQTGAVKQAASFMGQDALVLASTVKFFRSCLIIPAAFLLMFLTHFKGGYTQKLSAESKRSAVNFGIVIALLFFGASILFTFSPLKAFASPIKPWFTVIFAMALVSVGLLCNVRKIMRKETVFNIISSLIAWALVATLNVFLVLLFL